MWKCRECGGKAVKQKTNWLSQDCADVYYACKDVECGHTFVVKSGYSHTLSPSAKTTSQLAFNMIKALAPEQRAELQQQLSML